jgi:hypothetical protein
MRKFLHLAFQKPIFCLTKTYFFRKFRFFTEKTHKMKKNRAGRVYRRMEEDNALSPSPKAPIAAA